MRHLEVMAVVFLLRAISPHPEFPVDAYRNKTLPLLRKVAVGDLGHGVRDLKLNLCLRNGHKIDDPALDRLPVSQ